MPSSFTTAAARGTGRRYRDYPFPQPAQDGGFKYNPPHGGPAETRVTGWIQERANTLLRGGNREVKRVPYESARKAATTHPQDFVMPYVKDLRQRDRHGLHPVRGRSDGRRPDGRRNGALLGADPRALRSRLNGRKPGVDPRFSFMAVDHDGKIRMDCSSPYAMAGLVKLKDRFDIAFGNDTDADRHGIVTRSMGLMNPNHYLAVAIDYLLAHRPGWPKTAAVGKTLVSSGLIDRVVGGSGRQLSEVPVGFKWFVDGLFSGCYCFGAEESAGASFLRRDGTVWTTDKDGPGPR